MRVWSEGAEFKSLVLQDEEILKYLSRSEIETSFDLEHQLRHVDAVFERVFSG